MIKHRMVDVYMDTARCFSKLSYAKRKKVGAVAITPQDVILTSWNGRPSGDDNNCEINPDLSHPEVLHAESNLVAKAAREGISLKGSVVVVTLSPCLACSMQMYQAGVVSVIYDEEYRITDGIKFLKSHNVHVEKYGE